MGQVRRLCGKSLPERVCLQDWTPASLLVTKAQLRARKQADCKNPAQPSPHVFLKDLQAELEAKSRVSRRQMG